jgi:hypothetical protein
VRPPVALLKVLAAAALIAVAILSAGAISSLLLGPAPESLSGYVPAQVSTDCGDYVAVQAGEYGGGVPAPSVQCEEPLPR